MRKGFINFIAFVAVILLGVAIAQPSQAQDEHAAPVTVYEDPAHPAADVSAHDAATPADAAHEDPAHAGTTEHGGEHGNGGLPQLNPQWFPSQIFWLAIAFAVLYVYFSKKALPEIGNIQQRRAAHIEHDIATAQKLRENAEEARGRYDRAVSDAQRKSTAIFLKAEDEVKAKTAAALEEFKSRSILQIQDADEYIEKAKKEALESIHSIAAEIASLAAEKIIGIPADIDQAKTVVRNINKKAA